MPFDGECYVHGIYLAVETLGAVLLRSHRGISSPLGSGDVICESIFLFILLGWYIFVVGQEAFVRDLIARVAVAHAEHVGHLPTEALDPPEVQPLHRRVPHMTTNAAF